MIGGNGDADMSADVAVFTGPYPDLPADPVGAGGIAPAQVPDLSTAFGTATNLPTGGPCLTEPTIGALFPSNFNSPLFEWTPPAGHNVFELRFHIPNQINDLVVYTDQKSFNIADPMWQALGMHSTNQDITVQVRSGVLTAGKLTGSVLTGTVGAVRIAPVAALGAIVYWTTSGGSALKGFHIGDKGVTSVLTPASITTAGTTTTCIGCHISTPDGLAALFGRGDPRFSMDVRLLDGTAMRPAWITPNGLNLLSATDQVLGTMNSGLFSSAQAIVVTAANTGATAGKWELVWNDLRFTTGGQGIVLRTGDPRSPATPVFNGFGSKLAYTSSDAVVDSRVGLGVGEIWTVPYNNGQGSTATGLPGASDAGYNQYYPAYSPGDTFLAFNRIARGIDMYNAKTAEVFLVPGSGGTPVRITANDPPTCSGLVSPGITNSWPHWSPSSTLSDNKRYYWLVFSSTRRPSGLPQLYLSAVITDVSSGSEVLVEHDPGRVPSKPACHRSKPHAGLGPVQNSLPG